jgi:tetratricopeptide (TPR) repeat protein
MAARLFRLLSLHPAPDTATPAAASLAGVDVRQVKALLDELARAHLVSEHSPGRYQMHDLLRAYAAELSAAHDPDGDRAAARRRVLDHFLHTSVAAARLLAPHDEVITPPAAQPGVTPESLTDHRQAISWFGAEYQSLLALLEYASASGLDADTWYLASTMWVFLERRGRWHELIGTETLVLQVVRQHADRPRQAAVHRALGMVRARLGCYDDARDEFETALELARKVGDIRAEAAIHLDFASLHGELRGNYHEALVHSRRALGLCESIGDAAGTAKMLNAVGWGCAQLGDQRQALALCTRALAIQERLGDRNGQAATRDSLGYVHHQMGDHERAIGAYRAAVALRRDTGHRYGQAAALLSLAEVYDTVGDDEAARDMRQEALAVFVELGHPDAERVRAKLRGLDPRQLAGRR